MPAVIPVTIPDDEPIVPVAVFTELHIPPPIASLKVVVLAGQTVNVPVIVPALIEELTVTIVVAAAIPQLLVTVYDIVAVPSYVLAHGNSYDKLSGNVTLKYALEKFAKAGDLAREAQWLLQ